MDAAQILRRVLDKVAVEQKYDKSEIEIKPISSDGANYTSALFLATISASEKDILNLFAKVATIGEGMRETLTAAKFFDNENFAYTELLKAFDKIQDKYNVPEEHRFVYPKFYAFDSSNLQEILVLENLAASGYESYSRFESVDWEYASQTMTALAKFHALGFAYKREDPEAFQRIAEERAVNSERSENDNATMAKICQNYIMAVDEKYRSVLQKFMEEFSDMGKFQKYYYPLKHAVIAHGDFRVSNLLSKTKEDGSLDIVPVDYQLIHAGRPTVDIVYFLFTGTDQKFRAQHYVKLIDVYYENLGLALRRMNMDVERVYPRKDFDEELKDTLPFGLMMAIFVLPLILVEPENAPTFNEGLEDFQVKTNELYAERLTGIVEDLLDFGVI